MAVVATAAGAVTTLVSFLSPVDDGFETTVDGGMRPTLREGARLSASYVAPDGLGVSGEGAIPQEHVLGVVVAVNGDPPDQTPAFAAAGLPGSMFDDSTERLVTKAMVIGGICVGLAGLFWFHYSKDRT